MDTFIILNEKRRTISKWSCLVDLMSEIKKETNEPIAFKLTAIALMAMFSFPVEKSVKFIPDKESEKIAHVTVTWLPSEDTMTLWSNDGGQTFMVEKADTEKIVYQLEAGKSYTCYTIDIDME